MLEAGGAKKPDLQPLIASLVSALTAQSTAMQFA
jgi:hypothetical protein